MLALSCAWQQLQVRAGQLPTVGREGGRARRDVIPSQTASAARQVPGRSVLRTRLTGARRCTGAVQFWRATILLSYNGLACRLALGFCCKS